MSIESYENCPAKRAVQSHILQIVKPKKVVGLGGPSDSLPKYYRMLKKHGVKDVVFYENDRKTWMKNVSIFGPDGLNFGDIINAPIENDWHGDLDFCGSIVSFIDHVHKFVNNSWLTFALRPVSEENTIKIFVRKLGEKIVNSGEFKNMGLFKLKELVTNKSRYNVYRYRGGEESNGTHMIVFLKLNQ